MSASSAVQELAAGDLGALLDAGDGAVVTLLAGETRLAAHRAVLAARSPVFSAMFQHEMLEATSGEVTITDVEGPVLRQLVAYCYTLQAPQLPDMAPQLLAAADKYGLSALKGVCEQQVAAQLDIETAAATAIVAVRHSCPSLTPATVDFIRANLQVMATQGWADAVLTSPKDIVEVSRLVGELPAGSRMPATATPGTHNDHGSRGPATAAAPMVPQHTAPPDNAAVSRFRIPVTMERRPAPGSQPRSDHGRNSSPDGDGISCMRSLSEEERGKRFIQAAKDGALEELHMLFVAGADDKAGDKYRQRALWSATNCGQLEAVRYLLKSGVEVDARSNRKSTAMHRAAWYGHVDIIRLLVAFSADPNATTMRGRTPLHVAAERGHAEAVAVLLAAGATRGAQDRLGITAQQLARMHYQQEVVEMLTQR